MSLKPIDLQNLFVRLNQVGREQAAREEAPLHAQQVAAEEIAQKTRQSGEKVNAAAEPGPGPEKVHDDEEESRNYQEAEQHGKDPKAEPEEGQEKQNDPFKDPDLGNTIDING
ncbi:MAG: hypothetical protein ACR2PY_07880 [Salinispira sp.]